MQKLPFDVFYMAYYFDELLGLAFDGKNVYQYIYMKQLLSRREFMKRMQEKELRFFGQTKESIDASLTSDARSSYDPKNASINQSQGSIDYEQLNKKKPQVQVSRRFQSKGNSIEEFTVNRHGNDYSVQVFDETEQHGRY